MELLTYFGAVLAFVALALPALAIRYKYGLAPLRDMRPHGGWLDLVWSELGSSVTYCTPPYTPGSTALTAPQAKQTPTQTFQVFWADTDSGDLTITHNWGLPASFPNWLLPEVSFVKQLGGGSDLSFATNFTFGLADTNAIHMNKVQIGTGTGGTYIVYARRGDGPWR
jgi:hypothetical protein